MQHPHLPEKAAVNRPSRSPSPKPETTPCHVLGCSVLRLPALEHWYDSLRCCSILLRGKTPSTASPDHSSGGLHDAHKTFMTGNRGGDREPRVPGPWSNHPCTAVTDLSPSSWVCLVPPTRHRTPSSSLPPTEARTALHSAGRARYPANTC